MGASGEVSLIRKKRASVEEERNQSCMLGYSCLSGGTGIIWYSLKWVDCMWAKGTSYRCMKRFVWLQDVFNEYCTILHTLLKKDADWWETCGIVPEYITFFEVNSNQEFHHTTNDPRWNTSSFRNYFLHIPCFANGRGTPSQVPTTYELTFNFQPPFCPLPFMDV